MQRFFDILFSLSAIIIFLPLFVIVILILRITGEKEIFYIQNRIGKKRKTFGLIKFATMLKNSPNMASGSITVKDDPRVLPFGKILRKTKINELPQLFNILKGDMSVIGYRPLTENNFLYYTDEVQQKITKHAPGLSGIGSIVFRGEESLIQNSDDAINYYREIISPYKGELESWYADKKNILIYFLLIFLTVIVVINPNSQIIWKVFPALPEPRSELKNALGLNLNN